MIEIPQSGIALFHYHPAFVVKLTVKPVRTMVQMRFTGGRTFANLLWFCLIVCAAFVSAGFGYFSFRMCHFCPCFAVSSVCPNGGQRHLQKGYLFYFLLTYLKFSTSFCCTLLFYEPFLQVWIP